MSKKSTFFAKLKERGEETLKYNEPKFKVGDIIINTYYNVLSQVIEIRGEYMEECGKVNYKRAQYILKDLQNKNSDMPVKNKNNRWRDIRKIDPTYDLVKPEAARILYGIEPRGKK